MCAQENGVQDRADDELDLRVLGVLVDEWDLDTERREDWLEASDGPEPGITR